MVCVSIYLQLRQLEIIIDLRGTYTYFTTFSSGKHTGLYVVKASIGAFPLMAAHRLASLLYNARCTSNSTS